MNSKMGFYINLPYKMFPYKLCDILFVPLHHIHLRYHIFHITTKIFMLHKCKHILSYYCRYTFAYCSINEITAVQIN
jgi:hypothetical protein